MSKIFFNGNRLDPAEAPLPLVKLLAPRPTEANPEKIATSAVKTCFGLFQFSSFIKMARKDQLKQATEKMRHVAVTEMKTPTVSF